MFNVTRKYVLTNFAFRIEREFGSGKVVDDTYQDDEKGNLEKCRVFHFQILNNRDDRPLFYIFPLNFDEDAMIPKANNETSKIITLAYMGKGLKNESAMMVPCAIALLKACP